MKIKINSLIHNGPVFPPEYEVKNYDVKGTKLSALAEEMLWAYSSYYCKENDYIKNPIFNKNFYSCLKNELSKEQQKFKFPEDFSDTLQKMFVLKTKMAEDKKVYNKEHKSEIDKEKEDMKNKHGIIYLNGKPEPASSYLIESPGIIMTRGKSPILGLWKYRTMPEDVIINYVDPTGKTFAPKAPAGHHWKEVISNKNGAYSFWYLVNVGNKTTTSKQQRFAVGSSAADSIEQKKYENALNLLKSMKKIDKLIADGLNSNDPKRKQCAVILALCKQTAIRIGNEQDEEIQACTQGLTTLNVKNISLRKN